MGVKSDEYENADARLTSGVDLREIDESVNTTAIEFGCWRGDEMHVEAEAQGFRGGTRWWWNAENRGCRRGLSKDYLDA